MYINSAIRIPLIGLASSFHPPIATRDGSQIFHQVKLASVEAGVDLDAPAVVADGQADRDRIAGWQVRPSRGLDAECVPAAALRLNRHLQRHAVEDPPE